MDISPYRNRVKEIFRAAQASKRHREFVEQLKSLRTGAESEEQFREDFIWCLKHVMIIYENAPNAERIVDFAAMFAVAAEDDGGVQSQKPVDGNISLSEDNQPVISEFLTFVFNFLLESYEANDKAVRFRVCQLINKLLNQMGDDASIDDDMADRIYDCMLVRVRDKFPKVRGQAIAALVRLQDPQDPECPVVSAFLQTMQTDTSAEVRRAALSNIALSALTLPFVIERTRDVTENNRKLAFRILAEKVNVKAFTIAQRLQLLENGLCDKSEEVKKSAKSLMQAWLQSLDGQVTKFLNCLHVETSGNTPEVVLNAMFKDMPKDDLQEHINTLLEYNKSSATVNIGFDELSCENALYWRHVAQYAKKSGGNCDELLDQLIPELSVFCKYIRGFVDAKLMNRPDNGDEEETQLTFILRQLLLLTGIFDLADEVGRKELQELIRSLLVNEAVPLPLVGVLIDRYRDVQPDEDSGIQELVEIISDIRQPIVTEETPQIIEEKRKLEIKMASIRVKLNQYREELQESVEKQEFSKAAELKQLIVSLEQERDELQEEDEKISSVSIREERDDPWILERCLTISCEMLKGIRKRGLSPTLRQLAETLFLTSGIQNEEPQVRNVAVMCLGLTALQNLDFAKQFLMLFLQISKVDVELVRVNALMAIFDLLLVFGFEALMAGDSVPDGQDDLDDFDEEEDKAENDSATGENLVNRTAEEQSVKKSAKWVFSFLTSLLDSESVPLRQVAADGMARLLVAGRISSAKLITQLVLLWYSPVTEDDTRLRHCLGLFLPTFAFASRVNQELIEEAFLPTLKAIFEAPAKSPLASINANELAFLFVQLCDSNNLDTTAKKSSINNSVSTLHFSLALKIANEILEDVDAPYIKVLCKALTLLDLSGCDLPNIKELKVLLDELLEHVDDGVALRYLKKFQGKLELLDTSSPEEMTQETSVVGSHNREDNTSTEESTSNCTKNDTENDKGDSTRNEAKTIEEGNGDGRNESTTEGNDRVPLIEKNTNKAGMAPPSTNQRTKSKASEQRAKTNRMTKSTRRNKDTMAAQLEASKQNCDSYEGRGDVSTS